MFEILGHLLYTALRKYYILTVVEFSMVIEKICIVL